MEPSERKLLESLSKDGRLDEQDGQGRTALMLAARKGKIDVVSALLEAGAKVDARAKDGSTALHEASKMGRVEVLVRLLAENCDVDAKDDTGATPLMWAAAISPVCVARLLKAGANLNVQNMAGSTASDFARASGHMTAFELMSSWAMMSPKERAERSKVLDGAPSAKTLEKLDAMGALAAKARESLIQAREHAIAMAPPKKAYKKI
jgi:ankyrin repeat protein